ncbi:acyltransferase [Stenotrophomonas sp. MMGLT7]|uniref:acyltransferase family protein n=1 Tax=Stenotrophomonas sp. MMGLT7 TaxID=2901227 RepID=UPI001E5CE026|nr:acyltransferase [Stenotrophomonas sp. MMGLT7]MCD7097556.1 acyltransferase [Stenotrophomonas sp. MMGLT7]
MHGKIVSIHYLRGLCALLVVVAHFSYLLPESASRQIPGALGVDIFFMISGFIITLVTRDGREPPASFAAKRFFRIYPVFFVVWLLATLALYRDRSLSDQLCSLALCLEDYRDQGPEFGYNMLGPPWTLTYEVYFYLLFCAAMAVSRKYRVPLCILLIVALTLGLQTAANGSYAFSSQASARFPVVAWWNVPLQVLSNTIFYEFAFGMVVAVLFERASRHRASKALKYLALAVLLCAVPAAFVEGPVPFGMSHGFWFAAPIFAAVVLLGLHARLPEVKSLGFLGDVSYSLYLLHFPLMNVVQKFLPAPETRAGKGATFVGLLVASLALALLFHKLVELPAIRWGRAVAARLRPPGLAGQAS